jgi:hypothetical protein
MAVRGSLEIKEPLAEASGVYQLCFKGWTVAVLNCLQFRFLTSSFTGVLNWHGGCRGLMQSAKGDEPPYT